MNAAARQACIEKIQEVATLRYDPGAIDQCLTALRERMAHVARRDALCTQIEALLRAGNAPRAAQLLEEMPLAGATPVMLWVIVALLAAAALVGGIFYVIETRLEASQAQARAEMLASVQARPTPSDAAEVAVTGLLAAFVDDLGAGRIDAAYGRTSPLYRGVVTPDRFKAALEGNRALAGASSPTPSHFVFQAGAADVRGTLALAGGERVLFTASCAKAPDGWRVTAFTVANVPVLPQGPR